MNLLRNQIMNGVITVSLISLLAGTSVLTCHAFDDENVIVEEEIEEPITNEIRAFGGEVKLQNYNYLDIQGEVTIEGNASGIINGYNIEELYEAYDLTSGDNYKVLFDKIKSDKNKCKLIDVFENAKEVELSYNIDFTLHCNEINTYGIYITGKAVLLEYKGETKKFISTRPKDSGAVTGCGDYYYGYTVIEPKTVIITK
jgi:hypothetical protein